MKPQQLQGVGLSSSGSSFSQLGCVPPLLPQQTPQVYVSQSAAGELNTNFVLFLISELSTIYQFSDCHTPHRRQMTNNNNNNNTFYLRPPFIALKDTYTNIEWYEMMMLNFSLLSNP